MYKEIVFPNNLKFYRLKRRLSQESLSKLANISCNAYGNIERGIVSPSFISIVKVCRALNIEVSEVTRKELSLEKIIELEKFNRMRSIYPQVYTQSRVGILRKNIKKSQRHIAELAGISNTAYARIESGKSIPHITTALKIAHAFNMKLDQVFVLERSHEWFKNKRRYRRKLLEEMMYQDLFN